MTPPKTPSAPKPVKAWAINVCYVGGPTEIRPNSVRRTRREAILQHEEWLNRSWQKAYREGDRCIRVTIMPA